MLKLSTLVVACVAVSGAALADDTKMGDLSSRGLSALAATHNRPELSVNPRSGLDGELGATKGAASSTGLKVGDTSRTDPSLKFGSKLPSGSESSLSSFSAGGAEASAFSNASASSSLASMSQPPLGAPATLIGATADETGAQLKSLKATTPAPTQMLKR